MNRSARAILLALALLLPAVAALPAGQNDAGSGRDAPDTRDPDFRVAPGAVHEGMRAPSGDAEDFYAFFAEVGQTVQVRVLGAPLCPTYYDEQGARVTSAKCVLDEGGGVVTMTATRSGVWFVTPASPHVGPYRFGYDVDKPAPFILPLPRAAKEATGDDRACGTGAAPTATHGAGADGLVFAAVKTGTRAIVAWSSKEPEQHALRFNVSGGDERVLVERAPETSHVFILDGLPRNETLCFRDATGAHHALRLANAMYAHDGEAYVLNIVVLANEQPDVRRIRSGIANYAWRLHDATDGHVKSGAVITLYGDAEHHNSGWVSCYLSHLLAPDTPTCNRLVDVIFTADAYPAGAASTNVDAIWHRDRAIWMNWYWQAGIVNLGDDVGSVLMHEMGHYAFAGQDLYYGGGCDVPEKSLSVMSSGRALTEFDDEVHRCPNEAALEGYVPTWTLLRERFPLVPDREGVIDPGPMTPGDAFAMHEVFRAPQATSLYGSSGGR